MISPFTADAGFRQSPSAKPGALLPELRQDLQLLEGAKSHTGARRWLIHDPLQNRFIAIDRTAFVMLQLWRADIGSDVMVAEAWARFGETLDDSEVKAFAQFLTGCGLTVYPAQGGWRTFANRAQDQRNRIGSRILHGYLFFRVPLFHPERFLNATIDFVRPLATQLSALVISTLGLFGLYLISREWDYFLTSVSNSFSFEGAALLAVALVIVKLFHELGHAYVAAHYKCRVPVIGVAFVLGMPMLYCDVTDAWRLKSRRQRLQVDAAGILVDLAIACIATCLWSFLPPGWTKDLAFSLATAGWIFSLVMNLNPFMKFDGYHMLADTVGIENLQSRAMAQSRWWLRELLFGLGRQAPEPFSSTTVNLLVAYGFGIWLYRLITFTLIALAVYAFFLNLRASYCLSLKLDILLSYLFGAN